MAASRMVLALTRSSTRAEQAAFGYARQAAEGLRPLLEAGLGLGETLPDIELLVRLLGRALERERLTLTAADRSQGVSNRQAVGLRKRREQLQAELRAILLEIRAGARAACGKVAGDQLLQLEGRLSRDPTPLIRQGQDVLRGLEQALAAGWKPKSRVLPFDLAASVEVLRAALRPFEEAVDELATVGREGVHRMAHKQRLYSSHRVDLAHVIGLLEALLLTAGLPQNAGDVRLRKRRKPRRESAPEPSR